MMFVLPPSTSHVLVHREDGKRMMGEGRTGRREGKRRHESGASVRELHMLAPVERSYAEKNCALILARFATGYKGLITAKFRRFPDWAVVASGPCPSPYIVSVGRCRWR